MLIGENTIRGKGISMNQYNKQNRSNLRNTRSGYRRDAGKNGFLKVLLFYVLPFIVVNGLIFFLVTAKPKGEITIGESSNYTSTDMELKIKSLLPVKQMEAAIDGAPIEMKKSGPRTYTAVLTNNGVLEVKLISFNKMKTVIYEQVDVLDDTPPAIKDYVNENGILTFRLEDSQSGVDFSSIYGSDEDNPEISPLAIDRSTGSVTFELKKDNLIITAKDMIGNEMHVTFNPQGENIDEDEMQGGGAAANTES